jgi:hypothetical protein
MDLKVYRCGQISAFVSLRMVPEGNQFDSSVDESSRLPLTRGLHMETILIVVLIVFLLGGGGWGYSRWRRN